MTFPIRVGVNALVIRDERLLLVEFDDETGLHYNLPGGGIESGESIKAGLKREVFEETCAEVEVGDLAFVIEYEPFRNAGWGGETHKLSLIFVYELNEGSEPRFPDRPDPHQSGVHWLPLEELKNANLLPSLGERLTDYLADPKGAVFLEEPLELNKVRQPQ